MTGLVYKDFLLIRKQMGYIGLIVVFYIVLVAMGALGAFILPGIVVMYAIIFPMTSFSYDDLARWDKYAVSTPAGRRGVVAGKYLFSLLLVLVGSLCTALLLLVMIGLGFVQEPLMDMMASMAACALVAILFNAVMLPLLIKFGAEKSRLISMVFFILVFGGIGVLGYLGGKGGLPQIPGWVLVALPVVFLLVAVGGFIISYFIAQAVFEKKEL